MNIIDVFLENLTVKKILSFLEEKKDFFVINSSFNVNILLASLLFLKQEKTVFYVASNLYKASLAYEALCNLLGMEKVNFYVIDEVLAIEALATSGEFLKERLFTVNNILEGNKQIIVTHPNALLRPLHSKQIINENIIKIKKNAELNLTNVLKKLPILGYKKTPLTQNIGEYSLRGGVLDVFPINMSKPIRIDLFDIEVEYIKEYDPISQLTNKELNEVTIYPLSELLYENPQEIIDKIKSDYFENPLLSNEMSDLENYDNTERLHKYIAYIDKNLNSIIDYVDEKIIIYDEITRIEENYQKTQYELVEYIKEKKYPPSLKLIFNLDFYQVTSSLALKVFLSEFHQDLFNDKIKNWLVTKVFDIQSYAIIDYANDMKSFIFDLKSLNKPLIITASSLEISHLIQEILKENKLTYQILGQNNFNNLSTINLLQVENGLSFGFSDSFEVIHESSIFKKYRNKRAKYRSANAEINSLLTVDSLNKGDYIVHYDYGIAQYLGIKTVELQGIKNDYITLKFANIEMYIPVENINLLEKYQGTEGSIPKLTTIGTKEWEKKKSKVKSRLVNMAQDLLKMQALREEKSGVKYDLDNEIQTAFEEDFEYDETPDQLKVVNEIKKDMEKGLVIDRLVCGDVGYGKTEVAMRIALKTVLSSKQVAYLAPTTILTRQHYVNFCERFNKYGVKVALLNRHVDLKKQKEIIADLKNGQIDIVIGTHRILSEDVAYKDLGLLIIDEEQRFGVNHKEKIKKIKNLVNVLTLTATPIPRTLHMSLIGVRQLSLIETPPLNRFPIQTYVLEYNANIIREAIYRELGRGGQVFYLHNRIADLDKVYRKLVRMVPEAKILMAHGQMEKNTLEDAVQAFIDKEYDVLLCTTIIETGIDIPNSNTLIVDMADRLGLAQMYQIRGRVGRSDRVSYAYFMFEEHKVLTQTGLKRLNAIKEFTLLGSGYKIAVRDLAIRGAGDILGQEQSGFIDSIGLDMYIKLLNDAMQEARGEVKTTKKEKAWNIEVSKHVSNKYVSDDEIKIYIHKQITSISSKEEKETLYKQLVDRFGELTEEIKIYLDKQYLDTLLNKLHAESIKEGTDEVRISLASPISNQAIGIALMELLYKINPYLKLEYKGRRLHFLIPKKLAKTSWMYLAIELFEQILKQPNKFFTIDL